MLKYFCILFLSASIWSEASFGMYFVKKTRIYMFGYNPCVLVKWCYHKQKNLRGRCTFPRHCPTYLDDYISGISVQRCTPWSVCCAENEIGKLSSTMCKKYEDLGFILEQQPILSAGDGEDQVKTSICPYEEDGLTVIYGGKKADSGEFPHMALIGYENVNKWGCSGSLISPRFVLTAAHCMFHREYGNASIVRLGDLNYTDPNDDAFVQQIPIKFLHKHPCYTYPSTYHDIALFELQYRAKLSIHVKPICIYTKPKIPRTVLASGWGDTEHREKGENDVLMKVTLDVFKKGMCSKRFRKGSTFPKGYSDNIQICAGSVDDLKDTCQGDSGGPIQIKNKKVSCSYDILGITAFGSACGSKSPAIYTRIYPYIEWIERLIYGNGTNTNQQCYF